MTEKTITVTQIRSPIGRHISQRRTLVALKLNKLHRTSVVADTPSNRGRIAKVAHLVRVDEQQSA